MFLPVFAQLWAFQSKWRFNWRKVSSWAFIRCDLKKIHQILFEKLGKVCKISVFARFLESFWPNLPNFGFFNQNGVFTGERCHHEHSFLTKLAKFVKLSVFACFFASFLPNLPNFGHFNQNGVFTGERCYHEPSLGAIIKKFIKQFFEKIGKVCKIVCFCPLFCVFCPICPILSISIKMAFSLEKGVIMSLH